MHQEVKGKSKGNTDLGGNKFQNAVSQELICQIFCAHICKRCTCLDTSSKISFRSGHTKKTCLQTTKSHPETCNDIAYHGLDWEEAGLLAVTFLSGVQTSNPQTTQLIHRGIAQKYLNALRTQLRTGRPLRLSRGACGQLHETGFGYIRFS